IEPELRPGPPSFATDIPRTVVASSHGDYDWNPSTNSMIVAYRMFKNSHSEWTWDLKQAIPEDTESITGQSNHCLFLRNTFKCLDIRI
ncbi:hypothetical protein CEXT_5111, partial [Caerostris extrusa]